MKNPTPYMEDFYFNGYEIKTRATGMVCLFVPRYADDPRPWITDTDDRYPAADVEPIQVPALMDAMTG